MLAGIAGVASGPVPGDVEMVLFDLGGVLIELLGVPAMQEMAGIESHDELWHRWLTCRWVRRFESGRCSDHDFATGVVEDWRLSLSPAAFLDHFRTWPTGPLPGAEELVRQLKSHVPVGCLSNTNVVHWNDHASGWPLIELLDPKFLSFEMGVLKPDRDIFEQVAKLTGLPPERVLFLDDNLVNVEGARALGFQARRVVGVEQAKRALTEAGVINTPSALS